MNAQVTMPTWVLVLSAAGLLAVGSAVGFVLGETVGGPPPPDYKAKLSEKDRLLAARNKDYADCRSKQVRAEKAERGLAQRVRELNNINASQARRFARLIES